MNKISNNINAIIFDLGGVILDIDFPKIKESFKMLGFNDLEESFKLFQENQIFQKFERGEIEPQVFRNEMRKACPRPFSDKQFNEVWNSLLIGYPEENIKILQKLKNNYRTFLMSNTNEIHYQSYTQTLKDNFGIEKLDDLFEKAYYSHTFGMRKPDKEFFELLIIENELNVERTLFIDDFEENINAAKEIGLQTIHLKGFTLADIFGNYA